jgi:hypothetical protein
MYLKVLKNKTIGQILRNKIWTKRFDNSNRKFFEIIVNPVKKKFVPKHFKFQGPSLLEVANKKYFPIIKTLLIYVLNFFYPKLITNFWINNETYA